MLLLIDCVLVAYLVFAGLIVYLCFVGCVMRLQWFVYLRLLLLLFRRLGFAGLC